VSERYVDDADWAPTAEQSSEDDEAQEGDVLASQEHASDAAEHSAIHIVDDENDDDADDLGDIDITDPEADAIVNDALEIDEAGEASIGLMRAIKHALDPKNIMNPGKIFQLSF